MIKGLEYILGANKLKHENLKNLEKLLLFLVDFLRYFNF